MTPSNGDISALLALYAGNSQVPGEFPAQKPVRRSFDAFFNLCLNKRLSKQSLGWWLETPLRPLWRHCNGPIALTVAVDGPMGPYTTQGIAITQFIDAHMNH